MMDEHIRSAVGAFPIEKQRKHRRLSWGKRRLVETMAAVIPVGRSVIDIGAGDGWLVRELCRLGYRATGVDGTEGIERFSGGLVSWTDLTRSRTELHGVADWGICIEVGEHVPKELEGAFVDQVCRIPHTGLVVSWAVPGQRGIGHVNCREPDYVASLFNRRRWLVDEATTALARELIHGYYDKRLLVFTRVLTCK